MAEALSRWVAPILSFTAEEIWENLPGDREASVFLTEWYELPAPNGTDAMGDAFWSACLAVRQDVNKAMEAERAQGNIRGSLDANVILYATSDLRQMLATLGDELRFVLITSGAELADIDAAPADALPTPAPAPPPSTPFPFLHLLPSYTSASAELSAPFPPQPPANPIPFSIPPPPPQVIRRNQLLESHQSSLGILAHQGHISQVSANA